MQRDKSPFLDTPQETLKLSQAPWVGVLGSDDTTDLWPHLVRLMLQYGSACNVSPMSCVVATSALPGVIGWPGFLDEMLL